MPFSLQTRCKGCLGERLWRVHHLPRSLSPGLSRSSVRDKAGPLGLLPLHRKGITNDPRPHLQGPAQDTPHTASTSPGITIAATVLPVSGPGGGQVSPSSASQPQHKRLEHSPLSASAVPGCIPGEHTHSLRAETTFTSQTLLGAQPQWRHKERAVPSLCTPTLHRINSASMASLMGHRPCSGALCLPLVPGYTHVSPFPSHLTQLLCSGFPLPIKKRVS